MNSNEELIEKYLDGTLTAQEGEALNSWLKGNPDELRKFTELVLFEQQIRQGVQAKSEQEAAKQFLNLEEVVSAPDRDGNRAFWRQWRPISAAASVGLLIGLLFSPASWAFVADRRIWRESFEGAVSVTLPGIPVKTGVWSGDEATVVTAQNGISPRQGQKMLRFESATYPGENSPRSSWSDIYRLVDIRELGGPLGERSALRLSASFNAASFPVGEEYDCSIGMYALEIDLAELKEPPKLIWIKENSVSTGSHVVPLKRTEKWQELTQELNIPPQTRFVLLHLAMVRKLPVRSAGAASFKAHYLDDVRLDLIQKPLL